MIHLLPLLGVLAIAVSAPAAIVASKAATADARSVVVIVPPWHNAIEIATAAGGSLLAPGRLESIAFVHSGNDRFTRHLYDLGAWAVLDSKLSRLLCISRQDTRAWPLKSQR